MDALWDSLHMAYPGSFKALFAATDQERLKHQANWLATIREAGLTGPEIKRALKRIALGDRPLDAKGNRPSNAYPPSLPEFIEIARPDRGMLGHASRRPASEVLKQNQGTPRGALLEHGGESANERRMRVGREHLDLLKASFSTPRDTGRAHPSD